MVSSDFVQLLIFLYSSWFCLASTTRLIQSRTEHRISFLLLSSLYGLSPGFVWLLSHSSWFCLASTIGLILIQSGAEHQISFLPLSSLPHAWFLSWFCVASFLQLLVLFGFHNSLNTNPKRSGTSVSIFTFQQFVWIISWFVRLLSHSSWFCVASTTHLIQIRSGAEHWISFLLLCRTEQLSVSYGTITSIQSESRYLEHKILYFRQGFIEGVRDFESVGDPTVARRTCTVSNMDHTHITRSEK